MNAHNYTISTLTDFSRLGEILHTLDRTGYLR
jgi:hypothetical protein